MAVRGRGNRAAPQHRYERQNFAECGELLRNASILMTRNQQPAKHGVARCGGWGDRSVMDQNDMVVRTGMGSYMDTGDQPSTSAA